MISIYKKTRTFIEKKAQKSTQKTKGHHTIHLHIIVIIEKVASALS